MFVHNKLHKAQLTKIRLSTILTMLRYKKFYDPLVKNNWDLNVYDEEKQKYRGLFVNGKGQYTIPSFKLVEKKGVKVTLEDLQENQRSYILTKKQKNKFEMGDEVSFENIPYEELKEEEREEHLLYKYAKQMEGKKVELSKTAFGNFFVENAPIDYYTSWRHWYQYLPRMPCTWMFFPDSKTGYKLIDVDLRNVVTHYDKNLGEIKR